VNIVVLDGRERRLQTPSQQDRDAVPEELRGQGDHDRGHVQLRHDQAVDVADHAPGNQGEKKPTRRGQCGVHTVAEVLKAPGEHVAREGHGRREAQVDLARGDDEGEPQSKNQRRRHRLQERHVNPPLQKHIGRRDHEGDDQNHQDGRYRQPFDLA